MTDAEHLRFILDLLAITRDAELTYEDCPFLWHVSDGRAGFSMACSDVFAWGCADAETVEPGDLPLLRACLAELRGAGKYEEVWLGILFCARKRGMRPMNRWMKDMREKEGMTDAVHALFCAAGPEREPGTQIRVDGAVTEDLRTQIVAALEQCRTPGGAESDPSEFDNVTRCIGCNEEREPLRRYSDGRFLCAQCTSDGGVMSSPRVRIREQYLGESPTCACGAPAALAVGYRGESASVFQCVCCATVDRRTPFFHRDLADWRITKTTRVPGAEPA
jgi:hypothetical protein